MEFLKNNKFQKIPQTIKILQNNLIKKIRILFFHILKKISIRILNKKILKEI